MAAFILLCLGFGNTRNQLPQVGEDVAACRLLLMLAAYLDLVDGAAQLIAIGCLGLAEIISAACQAGKVCQPSLSVVHVMPFLQLPVQFSFWQRWNSAPSSPVLVPFSTFLMVKEAVSPDASV